MALFFVFRIAAKPRVRERKQTRSYLYSDQVPPLKAVVRVLEEREWYKIKATGARDTKLNC